MLILIDEYNINDLLINIILMFTIVLHVIILHGIFIFCCCFVSSKNSAFHYESILTLYDSGYFRHCSYGGGGGGRYGNLTISKTIVSNQINEISKIIVLFYRTISSTSLISANRNHLFCSQGAPERVPSAEQTMLKTEKSNLNNFVE